MANYLIPAFLIGLLPVDLVAGLAKGTWPTQATLMVVGGAIIGLFLARQLWGGQAKKLETLSYTTWNKLANSWHNEVKHTVYLYHTEGNFFSLSK